MIEILYKKLYFCSVSHGITYITCLRNQYLYNYHLMVLSLFEEFSQFHLQEAVMLNLFYASGNFITELQLALVTVHRPQAYACIEGSQSCCLRLNILYT
jgi:hypothetical protein